MPVINRIQNRSDRPGLGQGPCGSGQARGRASMGSGMNKRRQGMRQGPGREFGRRTGMCRFGGQNCMTDEYYESSLENRILELEEENRKLREAVSR